MRQAYASEAEELFAAITSTIAEGIILEDAEGRVEVCNGNAERILGFPAGELAGRGAMEIWDRAVHEDGSPFPWETRPAAVTRRTGEPQAGVVMGIPGSDGALRWISLQTGSLEREGSSRGVVLSFTDVTHERAAQHALRFSEERWKLAVEGARDGVWDWNAETDEVFHSRRWKEILGYQESEIGNIRSEWENRIHPDDKAATLAALNNHLDGRTPFYEAAYRMKCKDGAWKWLLARGAAVTRGADGRTLRFVGAQTDITEHKTAEEKVRKSEERRRMLFDSAPVPLWEVDFSRVKRRLDELVDAGSNLEDYLETHPQDLEWCMAQPEVRDVNQATVELFEARDKAELAGRYTEVYTEQIHRTFKEGLAAIRRGQRPFRDEVELRTLKGRRLAAQIEATPAPGFEDSWEVVLISVVDITARKQAERSLQESEEKFIKLFRCSPAAIHLSDREDGDRTIDVNDAFEEMTGYRREEAAGRPTLQNLWEEPLGYLEADRRLLDGGRVAGLEFRFRRKDGKIRTGVISKEPIEINGRACVVSAIIDITERRRAETALGESEAKYRAIVENSHDGIAFTDAKGVVLYRSPSYRQINGYADEQRVGREALEIVHPEDVAVVRRAWAEMVSCPGALRETEYRVRHKDGSWRWVETSVQNLLEHQHVGAVLVTTRDITERRRAELALAESEALYRLLAENVSDVIWILDLEAFGFRYVSPSVERLLGYTAEEIVARDPLSTLTAGSARFLREAQVERMADLERGNHRVYTDEIEQVCRNGGTVWVEITSHSVINERTGRLEVHGISRDISQRKQAQEALRVSEERLRASHQHFLTVVKCVPDTIWSMDLSGSFTYVSPNVERTHGWTIEEALQLTRWETTTAEQARKADVLLCEELEKAMSAGYDRSRVVTLESEEMRKDGSTFWAEITASFIWSEEGQPIGITGVTRDITERKRAEAEREKLWAQLAHAQKMESVGRLAGGVAHDFNNLLTVINGYSKLAMDKLMGDDPLRDQLEEIYKAGERAAALTRQLLAFSRKQILQPRVLDLNRVVGDMQSILRRLVGEDVEVRLGLSSEALTVSADPHQLEQVLMNLAVNARDAMPGGGKLLIGTGIIVRGESYAVLNPEVCPGRYAMLTVSDTGQGMDGATLQRIFEPFFTTKEAGRGTGLGLSMVQGIVAQSGGHINVYSEPGRGTTFRIYLPALPGPGTDAEAPAARPAMHGVETILVVEDQGEIRDYAAAALRGYGYRVLQAANAGEALMISELESARIHLVLTDVVMPHTGGPELVERLKKLRPGIKTLFMSGYTDDVVVHHGVLVKGTQFIQKPFNPEDLAAKIRSILGPAGPLARVVVADDEPAVRAFLRTVLEGEGYAVSEASEGKEALRQARSERVDLVVTDLVMPEQEGIETIQALRRDVPGVGIIAISGAFGGQFLKTAKMLGADAVLNKPISAEVLTAKVAEVLIQRRR